MSEVSVIVKDQREPAKSFNKRLGQACADHLPTSISFHIVHGEPLVVLESDYDIATEEDVKNEIAEKVGDTLLEDAPLFCKACIIKTDDAKFDKNKKFIESKTEDRLAKIADIAGASVVETLIATGFRSGWVEPVEGSPGGAQWVKQEVSYALIIWEIDEGGEEEEEKDVDGGQPPGPEDEAAAAPSKEEEEEESIDASEDGASADASNTQPSSEEDDESGDAAE